MKATQQPADKPTAKDSGQTDSYHAYLVRVWKDGSLGLWRASAQSAQSGETIRFANLTELFAFVEAQTGGCTDEDVRVGWRSPLRGKPNS